VPADERHPVPAIKANNRAARRLTPFQHRIEYLVTHCSLVPNRLIHRKRRARPSPPENTNHCLIFEQEVMISSPDELEFLGLSPRETEISFWIYQRKTTWEIGKILEVSPRTVEKHIENIFRKLELNGREDLVRKIRSGCGAA
jgi:DNA-binding CsgD family transcriptional regulator